MTDLHRPESATGEPDSKLAELERRYTIDLALLRAELHTVSEGFTSLVLDLHKQNKRLEQQIEDLRAEKQMLELALSDVSGQEAQRRAKKSFDLVQSMRMKDVLKGIE